MSRTTSRQDGAAAPALALFIGRGLKRVRGKLAHLAPDPAKAIHDARRGLKRMRTAARLLREVDKDLAREIDRRCGEAARALSAARDADVAASAARKLAEAASDDTVRAAFRAAGEALAASRPETADRKSDAAAALRMLAHAQAALEPLSRVAERRRALERGAAWMDARAKRAFKAARQGGVGTDIEALHTWRKRVKDRWNAAVLLGAAWPKGLRKRAKTADALGDALGEDRDLALLDALIGADPELCGGASAARCARAAIAARREALLERAEALGRRLHQVD